MSLCAFGSSLLECCRRLGLALSDDGGSRWRRCTYAQPQIRKSKRRDGVAQVPARPFLPDTIVSTFEDPRLHTLSNSSVGVPRVQTTYHPTVCDAVAHAFCVKPGTSCDIQGEWCRTCTTSLSRTRGSSATSPAPRPRLSSGCCTSARRSRCSSRPLEAPGVWRGGSRLPTHTGFFHGCKVLSASCPNLIGRSDSKAMMNVLLFCHT